MLNNLFYFNGGNVKGGVIYLNNSKEMLFEQNFFYGN